MKDKKDNKQNTGSKQDGSNEGRETDGKLAIGLALGMCIGSGIGTCIGVATKNIGLWMPLRVSIGMCIGIAAERISNVKKKQKL